MSYPFSHPGSIRTYRPYAKLATFKLFFCLPSKLASLASFLRTIGHLFYIWSICAVLFVSIVDNLMTIHYLLRKVSWGLANSNKMFWPPFQFKQRAHKLNINAHNAEIKEHYLSHATNFSTNSITILCHTTVTYINQTNYEMRNLPRILLNTIYNRSDTDSISLIWIIKVT